MALPQLIIGNKNYSSWSLRAWLAMKHAGIEFEEIRVPLSTDHSKAQLLKHSGAGKVPVYKTDGKTIWDSLAICEYLAEQDQSLWPEHASDRAFARSVSAEMHSGFFALRESMPMNCRAKGRRVEISQSTATDIHRILEIWKQCRDAYANFGPWLFGSFSIADAMYAPVVFRFQTYGVEVDESANEYMKSVFHDKHVQDWQSQAVVETETIQVEEVGISPTKN